MSDSIESAIAQQIRDAAHNRMVEANALSEAYLKNMEALDQTYDQTIKALREQARQQGFNEARWRALVHQATARLSP